MEIHLTENEIVETLKRSSLTTVLVEGKDDMLIYRWIEQEIGIENANFLSCGGRDKLLRVFNRRDEFKHIKTIFIADKDCFVYDEVPSEYVEVIWTQGYSIENDLYYGKKIEQLLNNSEKVKFRKAVKNFIKYYAFELECYQKKLVYNFSTHPNQVLSDAHSLKEEFLEEINFSNPSEETISYLKEEYDLLIRGKSLFALLIRFLSNKNRGVKHSKKSLIEHCYKMHRTEPINGLLDEIKERLYA